MSEEMAESRPVAWEDKYCDNSKKDLDNCIINVFCGDDPQSCESFEGGKYGEKKNHKCIVNVFCNGKNDDSDCAPWNNKQSDGACIINIFCGCGNKDGDWDEEKCQSKKPDGNCIVNIFCSEKSPC